jgi:MSHA pilin protein MshC
MLRTVPSRAPAASSTGYTLVELVVVIAIAGVLAAFIAPRFWTQQTFSDRGYADELAAALRIAQKVAVLTGCPARVTVTATSYAAAQQAASGNSCNPADSSWATPVLAADGSVVQDNAPNGTVATPTGAFQFDDQGRLASGPATSLVVGSHTITIAPGTGLVQVQ